MNIRIINLKIAISIFFGILFMNLVFLSISENNLFYRVCLLYACIMPIFFSILYMDGERSVDIFRFRHFILLTFFMILYFSDGIYLTGENPDIRRIEIFQRFGPLNRVIIIFLQYVTVLAMSSNKKLVAISCLTCIYLTGFRSFFIDTVIIFLIYKAWKKRKLISITDIGMFVISLCIVIYVTLSRFQHLNTLSDIFNVLSYAQVFNITSVYNWAKSTDISPLLADLRSLVSHNSSFAQQYTESTGNMSVQTAAVTLYAYMAPYDSFAYTIISLFALKLGLLLCFLKRDPLLVIFSTWLLLRGLLSNGIIYSLVLVGIPLLFIVFVNRVKLMRLKI